MDPRQLENLYDEFSSAVYAFALQLTHNQESAKDLLQDVFCRIARRPRFTILNPRSFLLRCTYRAYVDLVRRESSRQRTLDQFARETEAVFSADSEDAQQETLSALLGVMASLPEEQRAVIHLKIWEERTFREIASILGIPANTAASRYRYAIDKMQGNLRLEGEHES